MEQHTARNFSLLVGAFLALYVSIVALTMLLFAAITLSLPDAGDSVWSLESAADRIRIAVALLVVFFPTYIGLTRYINTLRRQEQSSYSPLTKWVVYLSLLVGGGVLLGDVVTVIYTFLEGDTTVRFLLKAGGLAMVVALAFGYYLLDVRDYWRTHEKRSLIAAAVATIFVLMSIVWGLLHIDPPAVVREMNIDNNQIGDLQDMQWRIEDYYRANESLPSTLSEVYAGDVPVAPSDRAAYAYRVTGDMTYELCAEFMTASERDAVPYVRPPGANAAYDWNHHSGTWCFVRTIDDTYRQ